MKNESCKGCWIAEKNLPGSLAAILDGHMLMERKVVASLLARGSRNKKKALLLKITNWMKAHRKEIILEEKIR